MAKTVAALTPQNSGVTKAGGAPGDRFWKFFRVTADAAYPTGGYPLVPSDFGLTAIDYVIIINEGVSANSASWDTVNKKLQFLVMSSGAEVGNGADAHSSFADVIIIGY